MTGNLDGQRIGDGFTRAVLVFDPSRKRQRNPYRPAIHKKLDINRIGMSCGNGYDQRLKDAVYFLFGPAVQGMKILIHSDSISDTAGASKPAGLRFHPACQPWWISMAR